MKTIDQIIENENYKRLTSALDERVAEIAKKIRILLVQLDEESIDIYHIKEIHTNSGFTKYYLATKGTFETPSSSLEDSESYYYAGDFYCWIQAATRKDKLVFLNKAKQLFQILDERKEKACTDIESAIKEAEGL